MRRSLSKKIQKGTCLVSVLLSFGGFSPKSRALGGGEIGGIIGGSVIGVAGVSIAIYEFVQWLIEDPGYEICNALYKELLCYASMLNNPSKPKRGEIDLRDSHIADQITHETLPKLTTANKSILENSTTYKKTPDKIQTLENSLNEILTTLNSKIWVNGESKTLKKKERGETLGNIIKALGAFLRIDETFLKDQEGRTKLLQIENYDLTKLQN